MLYSNDKVSHVYQPNDSSIVATFSENYNFVADAAEATRLAISLLDSLNERICWILDFQHTVFAEGLSISLDEVIVASNAANAGVWHHPNVRQVVFVTDNEILKLIAQGLNSEAFGNLNVQVFSSLDDALGYARSLN